MRDRVGGDMWWEKARGRGGVRILENFLSRYELVVRGGAVLVCLPPDAHHIV